MTLVLARALSSIEKSRTLVLAVLVLESKGLDWKRAIALTTVPPLLPTHKDILQCVLSEVGPGDSATGRAVRKEHQGPRQ